MESTNIGIINLMISNQLKEAYFTDNLIDESKKSVKNFFETVKDSPILTLEFNVFSNIENKSIENELLASRYIDNNIKLFEIYTISEIKKEHEKLNPFVLTENISLDDNKIKLYGALMTLIKESLVDYEKVNVDNIHESFNYVLNYIKKPKDKQTLGEGFENINDDVIEIAINKFNEKYEMLSEEDRKLLKILTEYNDDEKETLLNEYKKETLSLLEDVEKNGVEDKIVKTSQKINEMSFTSDTADDSIISLYELKKGLLS